MSKATADKVFPNIRLSKTDIVLKAYGNIPLTPVDVLEKANVNYRDKQIKLNLYIMPGTGPTLIGRNWLAAFDMWPLIKGAHLKNSSVNTLEKVESTKHQELTKIFKVKFPKLFSPGPGIYNSPMLELYVKEGTKPQALKVRHVPFAIRGAVEEEIKRLVKLKHLEKVDASEWATPIVPVIKSNGSIFNYE